MNNTNITVIEKEIWETPKLTQVGSISALVLGGGGKLSPMFNDTGDIRKPTGQEGK